MHGGYARPPCGVTLTGSVRAHVPHALFLSPTHGLEGFTVRRVQSRGKFPPQPSQGKAAAAYVQKIRFPG